MVDHENTHVPLGQPTLRVWEINENSTRYERLQAAPSDDKLIIMWSTWIWISGGIAIFIGFMLVALLVNRKARSNPFNLFLIYLMVPDFAFSAFCGLTCFMNTSVGHYWSASMCQFQSFYLVFGVAANTWLNFFVAWELHRLLWSSRVLRKYQMPSTLRVTCTALIVYAFSCFLASWALWAVHFDNFPHRTMTLSGLGCSPLEYSRPSTRFFFVVWIPLVCAIPLVGVGGIGAHIWYTGIMPPTGKRRMLAMFLGRIIAAFIIMWVPFFAISVVGTGSPWLVFAGLSWGHFQGAVSVCIAMTKPDIRHAFLRLMRCQCCSPEPTQSSALGLSSLPMSRSTEDPSRLHGHSQQESSTRPFNPPTTNEEDRTDDEAVLDDVDDTLF